MLRSELYEVKAETTTLFCFRLGPRVLYSCYGLRLQAVGCYESLLVFLLPGFFKWLSLFLELIF